VFVVEYVDILWMCYCCEYVEIDGQQCMLEILDTAGTVSLHSTFSRFTCRCQLLPEVMTPYSINYYHLYVVMLYNVFITSCCHIR